MSLKGKLAFITGATSGIGLACATRLAAEGCHLLLWARRADRLDAVGRDLSANYDIRVQTDVVDVRDRATVERVAQARIGEGAVPDILLNNAGLAAGFAKLQEGNPDDWDRMLDTNVKGLLYVTRAFLPAMVQRGSGHVVNLGSLAGHQIYPMGNVYNASKVAVKALTEALSMDLLGTRLRVSSVDPGHVETEFAQVRFAGDTARAAKVYEGWQPLEAADVADVVAFVVSRPESVNILDVVMMSTAQRSVHHVHRSSS